MNIMGNLLRTCLLGAALLSTVTVQAQFTFTTNNGAITITAYKGTNTVVVIPDTTNGYPVTSIGRDAFLCRTLMTSVTLPDSITSVGDGAFASCLSLTNVTFGANLKSIGSGAFGLTGLASITIPASVTNVGIAAFADCNRLTNIAVDPFNPSYSSVNGVLFNKDQTVLVEFPGGLAGSYSIPGSVIKVGNSAFGYCNLLTNVTVPASVTIIGSDAFESCPKLTAVYFQGAPPNADSSIFDGDDLTVYYLPEITGWGATFAGRGTAPVPGSVWPFSFTVTNGTVTITRYLGSGGSLVIPSTITISNLPVTTIGNGAFAYGPGPSSVILPDSVTNIGDNAFRSCLGLTNLVLGTNVIYIGDSAFFGCISLAAVALPSGTMHLGDYAFYACASLSDITIPEGITNIADSSFGECTHLATVTISSGVTRIGDFAFIGCSSLTNVIIPGRVKSLGIGAFCSCTHLAGVSIGTNVASIGDSAFASCPVLASVSIPPSVSTIGYYVFCSCLSLTNIAVDPLNPDYSSSAGVLFNKDQTVLVDCPGGITGGCIVPGQVTNIQDGAFAYIPGLTSVGISQNVIGIGSCAFCDCSGLTNISVDSLNLAYTSMAGILFNKSQTMLIACPGGIAGSYSIPGGVTSIEEAAFYYCEGLTSVTVPASVTNIGMEAFAACTSLTNIEVDSLNPTFSSLAGVLFDKTQSTLLQCPSGIIGSYSVPASVTSIADYAFESCVSLTNLTIPDGITGLGTYTFVFCTNLTGIYFKGNAPDVDSTDFNFWGNNPTVYYLPGTTGWGTYFGWALTAPWYLPNPQILSSSGSGFGVSTNQFNFTISWATNVSVVVEACTNLADPDWDPVQTNTLSTGSAYFSDPQWTNYPGRFYRVRSP